MFTLRRKDDTTVELDAVIDALRAQMLNTQIDTKEYATMVTQLTSLYKLKEIDTSTKRVSPDTMAMIIGNLAGIVLILNFERVNVITTKAISFVLKSK